MIPRRVRLSGFLCYRDEQEVAFDTSSLWMLAGLNGSGKSTIFDAVTYALFGCHRGGSTNHGELINKESKSLSVEFEFLADGQPYLIRRTLRRDAKGGSPKGTQGVSRLDAASGRWVPVADTNLSDGFKAWIREKIGLNFETFTSSVLLLQGRAEKLLDSTPKGRAEVLAGIVDLERYQKVHEKADTRRKSIKATLEAVAGRLTGVPEVTNFELLAAENKIVDAEQAKEAAAKDVDRLRNVEFEARRWVELQARLDGLKARWDKAQALITESTAIEQAYFRLKELKDVIPHILVIQEKQLALSESERNSTQLAVLKEQTEARRAETEHAIDVVRRKRASHQKTLMQEEERLQEVGRRLRDLSGQLSQVRLYDEQAKKRKSAADELARLPKGPAELLRRAQETFDHCVELGKVVPMLDRFATARLELRKATSRSESLRRAEQKTREAGDAAKKVHAERKAALEAASQARQQADDTATEARTLMQQAKAAADEFHKMDGAKVCRACGQALTPGHFAKEKAKRNKELSAATARHKEVAAAQTAARAAETTARDQFDVAEKDLTRLREEYRQTKTEAEQAAKDVDRLIGECRHAYLSLPETYRVKVAPTAPADWLTTSWPTADEQRELKKDSDEVETARKQLRVAQDTQVKFERLLAEQASAQAMIDQLMSVLPAGDPSGLHDEEKRLKAEEEALTNSTRGTKKLLQENDLEAERLNKDLGEIEKTLANLDSQLNVEQATRTQHRDAIDRAGKLLPATWRDAANKAGLAEQNKWKSELEELTRTGTEARYQELAQTRASIDAVRQDIALAQKEAEGFAEEAQRPVEEVKARLADARNELAARDEDLQRAREEKAFLDRHREERERLRQQSLDLEKDLNYSTQLAQLLGRDRLQRYLVRTAERQIVDYANGILDRLSGGQLYLRLCGTDDGGPAEKALELEAYNRVTGSTPINVSFLSGSQRFRVAVSLALGIGQYASRQHRPIESVIIDEGFGCLDRNGRQVMIQELHNLRTHLECIVVVSHQEEFAEAFSDGYRFELTDGATRVTRFER
jgi:DNA repair protein SbcC/Rad50